MVKISFKLTEDFINNLKEYTKIINTEDTQGSNLYKYLKSSLNKNKYLEYLDYFGLYHLDITDSLADCITAPYERILNLKKSSKCIISNGSEKFETYKILLKRNAKYFMDMDELIDMNGKEVPEIKVLLKDINLIKKIFEFSEIDYIIHITNPYQHYKGKVSKLEAEFHESLTLQDKQILFKEYLPFLGGYPNMMEFLWYTLGKECYNDRGILKPAGEIRKIFCQEDDLYPEDKVKVYEYITKCRPAYKGNIKRLKKIVKYRDLIYNSISDEIIKHNLKKLDNLLTPDEKLRYPELNPEEGIEYLKEEIKYRKEQIKILRDKKNTLMKDILKLKDICNKIREFYGPQRKSLLEHLKTLIPTRHYISKDKEIKTIRKETLKLINDYITEKYKKYDEYEYKIKQYRLELNGNSMEIPYIQEKYIRRLTRLTRLKLLKNL